MNEEWKDIVVEINGVVYDYTEKYQISSMGRVRSLNYRNTGEIKIMKPGKSKDGYLLATLCKNGTHKTFKVHRLVATAFIPNPNNLETVNHIDEDKINNRVENLEWMTNEENVKYSHVGAKRSEETRKKMSEGKKGKYTRKNCCMAKPVICLNTGEKFDCIMDASDWCNGNGGVIGMCCRKERATSGKHPVTGEPLKWMYYNDYLIEQLMVS